MRKKFRWQLILEEFSPELIYINGYNTTVVDALSLLDQLAGVNNSNNNKVELTLDFII